MISVTSKGDFRNMDAFLAKMAKADIFNQLDKYGRIGVNVLSNATPYRTGETAHSWYYEVISVNNNPAIVWHNSHMAGDTPIAILIEYGHGTRNGGFVQGRDFINPAIQPVFDEIASDIWKVVTSA